MGTVEWTDTELARINDEMGVEKYRLCYTDAHDNVFRAVYLPSTVIGYRTGAFTQMSLADFSTPFTYFTADAADTIWSAYEATHNRFEDDIAEVGTAQHDPSNYRLEVRTARVPSRGSVGPHPCPDVREDVSVIDVQDALKMVVRDGNGQFHQLQFSNLRHEDGWSLTYARSPYSFTSKQTLRLTFEAIRAGQLEVLERGGRLSLTRTIGVTEREQVRPTDDELGMAEEAIDITTLSADA